VLLCFLRRLNSITDVATNGGYEANESPGSGIVKGWGVFAHERYPRGADTKLQNIC